MGYQLVQKITTGGAGPAKVSTGGASEAAAVGERNWRVAGIALLSVRVVQGFIY